MTIEFYQLGGPPLRGTTPRRYSVFSFRTDMALAHKGLPVEHRLVKVTDKAAIAFSGQKKVPIIRDGDTVVSDSFKIAEYLEATYPDRPSLFGGEAGHAYARFFNSWADRQLIATLFLSLMLEHSRTLEPDDAAHIRAGMEGATKKTLEELAAGKDKAIAAFQKLLDPVRSVLRTQPFVAGATARYPDYILYSVLQWPRVTSPTPILAPDDAVAVWFERMLDLFDGRGRAEPAAAA
jgi:glutathione S-transferase